MASKKKKTSKKNQIPSQALTTPNHLIMKAPAVTVHEAIGNIDGVVQAHVCNRPDRLKLEQSVRILATIVQDYLQRNPQLAGADSASPPPTPPAAPHVSKKPGSSKRKKKSG